MAGKLYWRIKKDGKWTWKPVSPEIADKVGSLKQPIKEEEE